MSFQIQTVSAKIGPAVLSRSVVSHFTRTFSIFKSITESSGHRSGVLWLIRAARTLAVAASVLAGVSQLAAYPVAYSVSGTFGGASGPDPLKLAGKQFSISATIDTLASCCPYTTNVTIQAGALPAISAGAQVSLSAGNPGSISVTATVTVLGISVPFSAQASVPLASSQPYPFAATNITGGTATYGTSSSPTNLTIASGSISASGTPPPLTATSNALTFSYQVSGSAPANQTDTITATGASFSITSSTSSGGTWLTVTPSSGISSATLTVSVNPAGLKAGSYSGSINVTSTQTANNLTISVTLNVTQVSVAYATAPSSLNFAYQVGGSPPGSQNLTISASPSANIGFTVSPSTSSGGNWLTVNPTIGATSASVSVSVNPAGLSPGAYSGSLAVTGLATNSPLTVPVTLTVTALLTASPVSLAFSYQTGESTPPSQTVHISASGSAAVSIQAAASGGQWLSVAPAAATTPSDLAISVSPAGLAAGTYNGAITVTSALANTVSIPVALTVATKPLLSVTPTTLTFGYEVGGAVPPGQTLSITGSSPLNYTVSASGGAWLKVTPAGGSTPDSISVAINPSGLAVNTYSANIAITAAGASNSPVNVPVVLQVVAQTTIAVTPSQLQFVFQNGGTNPAPQSIAVASDPVGVTVNLSTSGGNWFSLGSSSVVAPASVPVSINPTGLKIGTYTGTVSATGTGAANNPQTMAVSLLVTGPTSLTATPASLNFSVRAEAPAPAPQGLSIGSTTGTQNFTITSTATWVSASTASGVTPASLMVSINSAGLAPSTYSAALILTPSNITDGALTIPVRLTVTAPVPTINSITNAASYLQYSFARGMAPGSIISILGTTLGPATPLTTQLTSNGLVSTTLGNTSVVINNQPSPLLYVSPSQINAIVPYSTAEIATIKVVTDGVASNILTIPVAPASPALFTVAENGRGQGAILNQDGTVNSSANPAAKGSIIVLYGDGAGQTSPQELDGAITSIVAPLLPQPLLPVTVQIAGEDAQVTYAGAATSFVAGMLQVNVQVPADAPSGNVPVLLSVGNVSSQPGVTVAIQ